MTDNKHQNKPNAYKPERILNVLYRDPDALPLKLDLKDPTPPKDFISLLDYTCPFDTSIPMSELDRPSQAIALLDSFMRRQDSKLNPRRDIQAFDIMVFTYRQPLRRSMLLLLDPLTKDQYDFYAAWLQQHGHPYAMFPNRVGNFNGLFIKEITEEESNLITDLVTETWSS